MEIVLKNISYPYYRQKFIIMKRVTLSKISKTCKHIKTTMIYSIPSQHIM